MRAEVKVALDRVRPLAWLLGVRDPGTDVNEVLRTWHAAVAEQPELALTRDLVNGLFAALGHSLDDEVWTVGGAYTDQALPPASLWFRFHIALDALGDPQASPQIAQLAAARGVPGLATPPVSTAGQAGSRAATALLLLQLAGSVPMERTGAILAHDIVSALVTMGFDDIARRLAVEMALAAGI